MFLFSDKKKKSPASSAKEVVQAQVHAEGGISPSDEDRLLGEETVSDIQEAPASPMRKTVKSDPLDMFRDMMS